MSSDITGFYKMDVEERRRVLRERSGLDEDDIASLSFSPCDPSILDGMIENVVGSFEIPLGIATNFLINGRDVLIPMATEEPSVVAAASKGAKMARQSGGFQTWSFDPVMIGQVQIADIPDMKRAIEALEAKRDDLIELANSKDSLLVSLGGGVRDIEFRHIAHPDGDFMVAHLYVDCRDAMGANAVNTMAEAVAPVMEELTGGRALLRIISNLADRRLSGARATFGKDLLGGEAVVDGILKAFHLAEVDPYRCSTHNKGIMNGISAVVRATGNDTRAVEAGAHSYAARDGSYAPLTRYKKAENGDLIGEIELPTAVGLVGGATKVHPTARACVKLMGIKTATDLGEVLAAVGLAQNLAALKALSSEGIQRGHMRLHARNLAIQAGAEGDEVGKVVKKLLEDGTISATKAEKALELFR